MTWNQSGASQEEIKAFSHPLNVIGKFKDVTNEISLKVLSNTILAEQRGGWGALIRGVPLVLNYLPRKM